MTEAACHRGLGVLQEARERLRGDFGETKVGDSGSGGFLIENGAMAAIFGGERGFSRCVALEGVKRKQRGLRFHRRVSVDARGAG